MMDKRDACLIGSGLVIVGLICQNLKLKSWCKEAIEHMDAQMKALDTAEQVITDMQFEQIIDNEGM
jgi:hypothetical protein